MQHTLIDTDQTFRVAPLSNPTEWDAFVEQAPGATFCHLSGWRDVITGVMRQKSQYLAARDADGVVRGVLPLMRLSSPVFGVRYVSVPYLNDGGPIGDAAAVAALRDHAIELADSTGSRLELRTRMPSEAAASDCGKVTVLLNLPNDADELWKALPAKVRSQVRRPQKAGMTARFGLDQLPAFYRVWSQNMRDLGTPVLPRRFFEAVARAFPDRFLVGCVYRDDVAVAAGAGLVMGMLGTVVHRYSIEGWPVGVVIALLGVLAAAVAARALGGGGGLLVAAIAVVLITQAMAFLRPGGDILVTDEVISYVWLFGAPAACVLAAVLPRSWFAGQRRQRR